MISGKHLTSSIMQTRFKEADYWRAEANRIGRERRKLQSARVEMHSHFIKLSQQVRSQLELVQSRYYL